MEMTPTAPIAVVIPVYNRAHTLSRTLGSVGLQKVMPSEIIMVDNGSTDGSVEIVKDWLSTFSSSHPGVRTLLLHQPVKGACAARNMGLEAVSAPFTMFFDSDDVMLPHHISDFAQAIAAHPEATLFGRDILAESTDGTRRRRFCKIGRTTRSTLFHHIFRGCLSTQRIVGSTKLFRDAGRWDESLEGWNDFELGVRLLLQNPVAVKIGGEPSVIAISQRESITGDAFSRHPERWEKSLAKIRSILAERSDFPEAVRWIDARGMVLAAHYDSESSEFPEAPELSRRLRKRILTQTDAPLRMKAIYQHQLRVGRLAWLLASVIL